jgi:D-alanyl-D-alanine carboxypeptidase/D-alanyl-D-alanine-endopeptidase (penicillin-binding protein 4)
MRVILCLLLAFFQSLAGASWTDKTKQLMQDEIKSVGGQQKDFGLWIKKGDEVVEINSNDLFVPASLSKIPTVLAFLDHSNMGEKFKTWVYHTGKIEKGVLKGDLYLKGGGDPSFVSESMWRLINKLKRSDIKSIDGQLFVDESYFDSDYYSEGRQQKRVDRAYDAPVSGLSFNWNALSIYVRPGKRAGDEARVYVEPDLDNIEIQNKAKTTGHSKTNLNVSRILKGNKMIIQVGGEISVSKDEKAFYKSIGDAALWTGWTFSKMMNQMGITYNGDVKKKLTPSSAELLVEHESWGMARVISALSKFSNNFVAEMLTKHLGKQQGQPGNIDDGLTEIRKYLLKKGWKNSDYQFINPSGFTRANKMRADHLGELLEEARKQFSYSPEFLAALPISGIDGTLKSRMKYAMKEKVRAKTGYLSGVVALGGYLDSPKDNQPMTFVFFYNGSSKKDWKVRAMFDRLLWKIYKGT